MGLGSNGALQVNWIQRTAQRALVHVALYVIAIFLGGVLLMLVALLSGGYFGLSASMGVFIFMLPFCIPGAVASLIGFRLRPSALSQGRWPLIATMAGLAFGVSATGVSLAYVELY